MFETFKVVTLNRVLLKPSLTNSAIFIKLADIYTVITPEDLVRALRDKK